MPEGYRPLSGREQAVRIALVAMIVLAVIDAISQFSEMQLLDRVIAGEPVGDAELTADDARVGLLSLAQVVLAI